MQHLTDTLTISATRLGDLAREITLQLGEWGHHKHFGYSVENSYLGKPTVTFAVSAQADDRTRLDFIDAFAIAMDAKVRLDDHGDGGQLMSVSFEYDLTGIRVMALVSVGGVR